ncbi:Protein-tyrosine-phosphatase [Mucor velutinosus]|uniref:Ataxin-10 homolog n=1 Tax=Mucor velutinosus TaxID=708070 RepID=A0AAN7D8X0_9FUNG|nr:Protein-tyrosine-phosphatase [Mucor velutinosus]
MRHLLDHLLSYKNGIETSDQLETALEEAIKRTLQDNTFRVQLGASDDYWKLYNAAFLTLSQDTNEQCVINLIKLTRNIVAGEYENQKLAIQYGALYRIEEFLAEKIASPSDNTTILQVCTQAICNMITNNATAIDFIWKVWMSNEKRGSVWSYMLSKSDTTLIMSTLVLIINCIRGSQQRCDLLVSKKMGQDIIAAILGDIERLHGYEQDKNFELGYTVISELITFGHFNTLYQHVDDASDKNPVSDHQVILLKLLDSKIHAHQKEQSFPAFIRHEELKFLTVQLNLIGKQALQVIVQVKENGSQLQPDQISNVYTAIVLLLQILNELFVLDEDHCHGTKPLLVDADALTLVTDMLGHLETLKVPAPTPATSQNDDTDPQAGFHFLKRECVRMMGTMCYKDKSMQDKIRQLGGIPLVLCQFKIDDSNPYLREYATVALRNIMENNPENQKLIEELKPEQVVETEELKQMGIVPELTQDGKLRIKRP